MLQDLKPPMKQNQCGVNKLLGKLDSADQKILTSAIDALDQWPAKTLSKELGARGLPLTPDAIHKHRRRACHCFGA